MNFSRQQLKAARSLLEIDQGELYRATGVSKSRISDFERGERELSSKNRNLIWLYFDEHGIEFTDSDGVRRKPEQQVFEYEGMSGFIEFLQDVHRVVTLNSDVVVNHVDERLFEHWEGDFKDVHQENMFNLGAQSRIIVAEGDENLIASDYAEYRWVSKEHFQAIPYYIYGNRAAFIDFKPNNVSVYVIHNQAIADFFRDEFNRVWERARAVPT